MPTPMELGGKGFSESAGSGSRPDSGRANMAVTTLVSQSIGTTECNPSENRSSRGGDSANGGAIPRGNSAPSHVAYSGNTTRVKDFQVRLQPSCYPRGEGNHHNRMTPCARNGSAGVVNGRLIQFQDLYWMWSISWHSSMVIQVIEFI